MSSTGLKIKDFSKIKLHDLRIGGIFPVDIYVSLKLNDSIVLYKKKGEAVNRETFEKLTQIKEGCLLILKADLFPFQSHQGSQKLSKALGTGGQIDSKLAKESADELLNLAANDLNPDQNSKDILNNLTEMVEKIITDLKHSPVIANYSTLLNQVADRTDVLSNHGRQVSALSVLFLMSLGKASLDEILDIGTAGLAHDLALVQLPQVIIEKHLSRSHEWNDAEKLLHMKHADLTIDLLKKRKISSNPSVFRTIEHHHENWDGSGFKGLIGNSIFRLARILRIADDAVIELNLSEQKSGLAEILKKFQMELGKKRICPCLILKY